MFNFQVDDQEKVRVIKNFTLPDGRVKTLPAQRKKKLIILEYMLRGIEQGRVYSEKEINEHIRQFHEDFATVRREFVMCQFMFRQNGQYELNPKEMWPL